MSGLVRRQLIGLSVQCNDELSLPRISPREPAISTPLCLAALYPHTCLANVYCPGPLTKLCTSDGAIDHNIDYLIAWAV